MTTAVSAAAEAVAERRERNATAAEAMNTPSKCRAKPIKNESNMESKSHWSSMQLLGAMETRE